MNRTTEHIQLMDIFIGKRIRTLRTIKGLTRQELAEKLKLTHQQLYKYEHGINRISASRIFSIAEALETPVSYFFQDIKGGADESQDLTQRSQLEMMRDFMQINNDRQKEAIRQLIHTLAKESKLN